MTPLISLREALADPALLGTSLAGDSWAAWRALLIAAVGEALTDDERAVFTTLTGRTREPLRRVEEFVGVIGRRGGKSRATAALAGYLAGLCNYDLAPGERGLVLCIAPDQRQATITLDYAAAVFEGSPLLRKLIVSRSADALELTNGIAIEVRSASFRRLRGPTYVAVIADEACFWHSDEVSANPDTEILNACRPGLATTGGPLFIISSPYARRGEVWEAYRRHFGPNGDPLVLVAQAPSRIMNPSLPQSVVDRAMERDAANAQAEYLAQFRSDLEAFVSPEAVQACTRRGVFERPPQRGVGYAAFVDPSGGSADAMTLAIGHVDHARETVVLDALREVKPPFSPEAVVAEFCQLLKTYHVAAVRGDRYAGEWPREQFGRLGIGYDPAVPAKSQLYGDLLALINSARIELLDHPRLAAQLSSLERRTSRGGRDSIDHPPGGHDDLANAVAGFAATNNAYGGYDHNFRGWSDADDDPDGARAWRAARLAQHIAMHS